MNNVFTAKLLNNLRSKKGDKGFTLIELLVVVIIIGVLAAVALPNLLAQVGKAREVEGKTGVGTIARAQQTRHFETGSFEAVTDAEFNDVAQNNLSIAVQSDYFDFVSAAVGTAALTASVGTTAIAPGADPAARLTTAQANGTRALSNQLDFTGGNYTTIICQTNIPSATAPTIAVDGTTGAMSCTGASTEVR